jgi:hypothetical protein
MSNLEYIARRKRVHMRDLKLDKMEVLEATGPGMITDAVIEVLRDQVENIRWDTFRRMKKPRIFGDVLILPIRAFAGGQKHSHSSDKAYGPALVQHHFGRSWYKPQAALSTPEANRTAVAEAGEKTSEHVALAAAEPEGGEGGEETEQEQEDEMPEEVVLESTTVTAEGDDSDPDEMPEGHTESALGEELPADA